jgi:cell division protein FtsQ
MSDVKPRRPRQPKAGQPPAPAAARLPDRLPDRMPDRPGRWKLFARHGRHYARRALAGAVLLGALFATGLVLHAIGQGDSIRERLGDATGRFGLTVETIQFVGNRKTPEPLLRAALGVSRGDPILGFSVRDARQRLETITWVKSATVERRLPGLVVVQIEERAPFALWQLDGKFTLVDRDGRLVTDSEVAKFVDQVPLIVGPGAPQAAAVLMDFLAVQPDILARMKAAVRIGERRWNLRMNNGADILLPEGAEAPALARLAELQAAHQLLDRPLQAVDLRLPDRLVIRPVPERPPATRKPT